MEQTVVIKPKMNFTPSREGKKYFVKTFGCQMNEHDSEKIAGMFELCLLYTSPSPRDAS